MLYFTCLDCLTLDIKKYIFNLALDSQVIAQR